MRVTIGDMDYYYAAEKRDCFNPDAMKLSSYYKQLGWVVNFVEREDDINRPFDEYYILREHDNTPQPPASFFLNSKIKWLGHANRRRRNFELSNVMLSCRPDYLLYPEKNTVLERAEQLRLLGHDGELLQLTQDYTNTFKRKKVLVVDNKLWTTNSKNTIGALKKLQEISNISFFEPIWIPKILSDQNIREEFFKLKLSPGANLTGLPVRRAQLDSAVELLTQMQTTWPAVAIGPLTVAMNFDDHWTNHEAALKDWNGLIDAILKGKRKKIIIRLDYNGRLSTPYFMLFEAVTRGMIRRPRKSGLEFIAQEYGAPHQNKGDKPGTWTEIFRDLLRQTCQNKELLECQWGDKCLSDNDMPGNTGEKEFEYGL